MAIIKTKIPNFNGYRASVLFKNGIGSTNDTRLIEWFRTHGYTVETEVNLVIPESNDEVKNENDEIKSEPNLDKMSANELKNYAKARGVFVGNTKDRDKLIAKLKEVM